jgi:hypothetical protein
MARRSNGFNGKVGESVDCVAIFPLAFCSFEETGESGRRENSGIAVPGVDPKASA